MYNLAQLQDYLAYMVTLIQDHPDLDRRQKYSLLACHNALACWCKDRATEEEVALTLSMYEGALRYNSLTEIN